MTASKHRNSFLEAFCRSCCSALINAVMKYSFSAAVVQSWRVFHGNLRKIALHHKYIFFKEFHNSCRTAILKNVFGEKCKCTELALNFVQKQNS